jgi:hypothetical protein
MRSVLAPRLGRAGLKPLSEVTYPDSKEVSGPGRLP